MTETQAKNLVLNELNSILVNKPRFHSWHEAFAIMQEEVEETWDEIKRDNCDYSITEELKQVAAVALKALIQCTRRNNGNT